MSRLRRQPPLPTPEPERFRRRQFVAPHRKRALILRLARPLLAAVAIVGSPSLLVGWVLFSDQFTVQELGVESAGRVPTSWAAERLRSLEGRSLFAIGLGEVELQLSDHEWVQGVLLRRRPPNRLEIEILEKSPRALALDGDRLIYLDDGGRAIAQYDPEIGAEGLVLLSAPEGRPDLYVAGLALLEAWRGGQLAFAEGLSEIRILTPSDFRVFTASLPFSLLVSPGNLTEGLEALMRYEAKLAEQVPRSSDIQAIDLRFSGRIVIQPAAPTPHNPEGARDV